MDEHCERWGLYPWWPEHGEDYVHPDDRAALRALMPYGKVFRLITDSDGYYTLQYGDSKYRAKKDLFEPVFKPKWNFGDPVRLMSHGKILIGVVRDIMWHIKHSEPYYYVAVDGKKLKKRFQETDLASAVD